MTTLENWYKQYMLITGNKIGAKIFPFMWNKMIIKICISQILFHIIFYYDFLKTFKDLITTKKLSVCESLNNCLL